MSDDYYYSGQYAEEQAEAEALEQRQTERAVKASIGEAQADDHAHICLNLAEQYKSDPVLFAALTDAAAIIRDLMRDRLGASATGAGQAEIEALREALKAENERLHEVLQEAAQICKDLDDEALAKESRLACGAECAAAIADLAARMKGGSR